jgi:predicted MPP superfamily phosphohydrolase
MRSSSRFLFILFFISLFFAWLDSYLFSGFKAALTGLPESLSFIMEILYWCFQGGILLFFFATFIRSRRPAGSNDKSIRALGLVVILVYVPALFFGIWLLGEDIYRVIRLLITGILHALGSSAVTSDIALVPRIPILSRIGLAASFLLMTGLIYAIRRGKYRYKVHHVNLEFPDLPEAFDGFTITQLSDIHAGSFDNKEEVKKAIELVNEQRSDVIFFTGDLVNNSASEMEPWVEVFEQTKADMGKYSILGNHDYGDYRPWPTGKDKEDNLLQLFNMHERIGFNLLRNENLRIEKNGQHIELLGIENWGSGRFAKYGDLNKTLEGTNDGTFKILLSHDPSHWKEQVLDVEPHIHLTLSGHTHGMQFGFEFLGIRFSPVQFRYKQWAGLYEQDKRFLYVNRGFGFLGFPGRLGIWPEITVITLRRKK